MPKRRKRTVPKPFLVPPMVWILLGWLLRGASFGVAIYWAYNDWNGAILIPIVPFAVAYGMIRRGRKMLAVRAEALLASDPRQPVLYLRSFQDEDQAGARLGPSAVARAQYRPCLTRRQRGAYVNRRRSLFSSVKLVHTSRSASPARNYRSLAPRACTFPIASGR
jgi:hypothetical protein